MATIRPYRAADLAGLRIVCMRTAAAGQDATARSKLPELVPDMFAVPYTEHDPGLCFVAEEAGTVVGYLVGCADTPAYNAWFRREWLPAIAGKYPEPVERPRGWDEFWVYVLHHSFLIRAVPEVADYPASVHLNLLPEYQGKGSGRELMTTFLAALREAGVPAVHACVGAANTGGQVFYDRFGFRPLEVADPDPVVWLGRRC